MTLPNKLTMLRILLIPVMVVIWYIPALAENYVFQWDRSILEASTSTVFFYGLSWRSLIMCIIFVVASVTDFFDGKIARDKNLITSFGKFADPLADKMLVFTAMLFIMVDVAGWRGQAWYWLIMPLWCYIIMIIREFMVSGIRMVCAAKGEVIAAGWLGKWKTFVTMVAIFVLFFAHVHVSIAIIGMVLMYIACLLTILSGIEYFIKSKNIILESI